MHWSKTRHFDYAECPRRFFYSSVAAPKNPEIRELEDRDSPYLVRHNLIRNVISEICKADEWSTADTTKTLEKVTETLTTLIEDEHLCNAQISICEACIQRFCDDYLPDLEESSVIGTAASDPVEFVYDDLTIMVLPELTLRNDDGIEILNIRSGSEDWRSDDEHWMRAGALTCWARRVLRFVEQTVTVTEVYLRDGLSRYPVTHSDNDIRDFIRLAKERRNEYAASARIRDFDAKPGSQTCRFCSFQSICPDYEDYHEIDYGIDALTTEVAGSQTAGTPATPREKRLFFLSHASEDKERYVRPLSRTMETHGLSFWLDEAEIKWGYSLLKSINDGLRRADYVIMFITDASLGRGWPELEYESIMTIQVSEKTNRILPLLATTHEKLKKEYPVLASLKFKPWEDGLDSIASEIKRLSTS